MDEFRDGDEREGRKEKRREEDHRRETTRSEEGRKEGRKGRARTRGSRSRSESGERPAGFARGSLYSLFVNDEFHITIGVVKLRMVRVDPGSWVVDIQHGVRLASALRAVVAQG